MTVIRGKIWHPDHYVLEHYVGCEPHEWPAPGTYTTVSLDELLKQMDEETKMETRSLTVRFDNVAPGEQAAQLTKGATAMGWGDLFAERDRYRAALQKIHDGPGNGLKAWLSTWAHEVAKAALQPLK